MSVLSVLGKAAGVAGAGFRGYAADQAQRVKDLLAQQTAARDAENDRINNVVRMGGIDPAVQGRLAKARADAGVDAAVNTATQLAPIKTRQAVDQATALSPVKVAEANALLPSEAQKAENAAAAAERHAPPIAVNLPGQNAGQTLVRRADAVGQQKATTGGAASGAQVPVADMQARYDEIKQHASDLAQGIWRHTRDMQIREGLEYGITRDAAAGTPTLHSLASHADVRGFGDLTGTTAADYARYQAMMNSQRALGDDVTKVFKGRQNEEAVLREVALAQITPDDYQNPASVKQKLERMQHLIDLAALNNPAQHPGPAPASVTHSAHGTGSPPSYEEWKKKAGIP